MLRLTLPMLSAFVAATTIATAQEVYDPNNWHLPSRPLTTLGRYVPELHNTVQTLAAIAIDTPDANRTIAATSWQVLAFTGMGSSMRSGRHKPQIKTLMVWLSRQQTLLSSAPNLPRPKRVDGVLMSLTFTRVSVQSNYKLLDRFIEQSINTWTPDFEHNDAAPPTTEETVLLAMLAETLCLPKQARLRQQVLAIAKRGAAVTAKTNNRLHAAARHYVALASGIKQPPEMTLATCWPDNALAAPLHAWLGAFAARSMPATLRDKHWQRVQPLIAKRKPTHLWPGAAGRDERTTTAMMLAVVGMCHGAKPPARTAVTPPAKTEPKQKGDPWNGPIK